MNATDGVSNINKERHYAIKVGSKLTETQCADKAKIMGVACTGNNNLSCPYYARPTEVGASELGECYVMGYERDEYIDDFNRTILDNVNQARCQETNQKLFSIYTTNTNLHAETQKRVLQEDIENLTKQNGEINQQLDERKRYLASTYLGIPVEVLEKQDALRNVQQTLNDTQVAHKRMMEDRQLYNSLYQQKMQWEKEQQNKIQNNNRKLNKLQSELQTKWEMVNNYNSLYDWNIDVLSWLQRGSFFLLIIIVGIIIWYNYDKIRDRVSNTINTVQSGLTNALPNIRLGNNSGLSWANITEF